MNDQRINSSGYGPCPSCGNDSWNDLGCMTCGLEFFPPSEAYWAASTMSVSERVQQLREDLAPVPQLPALGSPIERAFWAAHHALGLEALDGLVPEYRAGRYRIDFALPERKIGIELDGHATHSSAAAIAADRQRQRALESLGWRIIRFGGSEVYHDAEGCVRQAARLIEQAGETSRTKAKRSRQQFGGPERWAK